MLRTHRLLPATLGLLLSVLSCSAPERAVETQEPFAYASRSNGVLQLTYLGGMSMKEIETTVFPDGLVRVRTYWGGAHHDLLDEFEDRLTEDRVRELVAEAVASGLVRFDSEELIRRIRRTGGHVPNDIDAPALRFRIDLDFLTDANGETASPYSHSFLLDSPHAWVRVYRDNRPLGALKQITEVLDEIYWKHRKAG